MIYARSEVCDSYGGSAPPDRLDPLSAPLASAPGVPAGSDVTELRAANIRDAGCRELCKYTDGSSAVRPACRAGHGARYTGPGGGPLSDRCGLHSSAAG